MDFLVSSVDFDCLCDAVLGATNVIRSVAMQQHRQKHMISCIRLISSDDSFFSLDFSLTRCYFFP